MSGVSNRQSSTLRMRVQQWSPGENRERGQMNERLRVVVCSLQRALLRISWRP